MATRWEIELKLPRIVFLDGSFATVYRSGIPTGTPEKRKLILLPHAPSIRAANLEQDMTILDEPNPALGQHGNLVYEQSYDTNYLLPLSSMNPEWSMWLALCNIKGEGISVGSEKFTPFYALQQEVSGLRSRVKNMTLEISQLRKRNEQLVMATSKRIKEEFGLSNQDERINKVMPSEFIGTEVGRRSSEPK